MLKFYGMKLKDKLTGELERSEDYKNRYKDAILLSMHNHLRIERILASLSIIGFRKYAKELVKFLEIEIYGKQNDNNKNKNNNKNQPPLSSQSVERSFETTWKIYAEDNEAFYRRCFLHNLDELNDSVYFNQQINLNDVD